ncbi:hypothetical protein GW950_01890 [Candidatus Wolfebacteria bacterium]|nr:hypothetical protein [Candidatus Wolfebacteria bacterium]
MNYTDAYVKFLNSKVKAKHPVKVVFDCSNGVTGGIIKKLFKGTKIEKIIINGKVDGNFPAHGPNPMLAGALNQLKKSVIKNKADLGIAFDGDGDRAFFVDDIGRSISSDEGGYILMQVFDPPYIVGAVSSKLLKNNKKTYISKIGHTYQKELMRKKKANLGAEHSGHYFFKEFFYADSGILAGIEVINFVLGLDKNLSDWLDTIPKYYRSGEINFKVDDKKKILKKVENKYRKAKKSKLDGLTLEFNWGWFNLRPSNTENLLRLNMEAKNKKDLNKKLREVKKIINQ